MAAHGSWHRRAKFAATLGLTALMAACGGGDSGNTSGPTISIQVPTSAPTYATTATDVRLGGTIAGASFVHVRNALASLTVEGFVVYVDGLGSWFADIRGLGFGDNPITVIADADGTGARTAAAHITVTRPLQPAILISNCATCSFQKISRVAGSSAEGGFYAQVETAGGAGELAVHFFALNLGTL